MVRQTAVMVENGLSAFETDHDLDMIEKAFPANIKLLEALLVNSPSEPVLLSLLSRFYGSYCFAFKETELDRSLISPRGRCMKKKGPGKIRQKVNTYYTKGMTYGIRALEARHPGAERLLKKNNTRDLFLKTLGREDVDALFWYGFNLGAWVNRNFDSIRAVSQAHVVKKVMERVLELDKDYFFGSAHLFLLAFHASRSPMLGGRPDLALSHYHLLKKTAGPDFMLADLFYARYYLRQIQDKAAYVKIMQNLMKTKATSIDRYTLYNTIAARRAAVYLEDADNIF